MKQSDSCLQTGSQTNCLHRHAGWRRRPFFVWVLLSGGLTACSFVQLTDAGNGVAQASSADVVNCQTVGVVSATTRSRALLSRGDGQIREELIVLARNQAATLGANAIVPIGEANNGNQSFRAYKCE